MSYGVNKCFLKGIYLCMESCFISGLLSLLHGRFGNFSPNLGFFPPLAMSPFMAASHNGGSLAASPSNTTPNANEMFSTLGSLFSRLSDPIIIAAILQRNPNPSFSPAVMATSAFSESSRAMVESHVSSSPNTLGQTGNQDSSFLNSLKLIGNQDSQELRHSSTMNVADIGPLGVNAAGTRTHLGSGPMGISRTPSIFASSFLQDFAVSFVSQGLDHTAVTAQNPNASNFLNIDKTGYVMNFPPLGVTMAGASSQLGFSPTGINSHLSCSRNFPLNRDAGSLSNLQGMTDVHGKKHLKDHDIVQ